MAWMGVVFQREGCVRNAKIPNMHGQLIVRRAGRIDEEMTG